MSRTITIKHFRRTLAVANIAEPLINDAALSAGHTYLTTDFEVCALSTNTGSIYVGDKNVDNTAKPIPAGTIRNFSVTPLNGRDYLSFNLRDIYFTGGTGGDIIVVTYYAFSD